MMREERTWLKTFKNRDGFEPMAEENDLLPSAQSETGPTEAHWSAFGSLSIYNPHKTEFVSFGAVASIKKCISSHFPLGK